MDFSTDCNTNINALCQLEWMKKRTQWWGILIHHPYEMWVEFPLLGHSANRSKCLRKPFFSFLHAKKKWKSNNVTNSIRLSKKRVPMNGIGTCNAIKHWGFSTCDMCKDTEASLQSFPQWGHQRNDAGKMQARGVASTPLIFTSLYHSRLHTERVCTRCKGAPPSKAARTLKEIALEFKTNWK